MKLWVCLVGIWYLMEISIMFCCVLKMKFGCLGMFVGVWEILVVFIFGRCELYRRIIEVSSR